MTAPDEEQHDVAPGPDDRRGSGPARPAAGAGSAERCRVGHSSPPTTLHSTSALLPRRLHGRRAMAQTLLSSRACLADAEDEPMRRRPPSARRALSNVCPKTWTRRARDREECMPEGLSSSDLAGEISRHKTHSAEHTRKGEASEPDGETTEPRPDPVRDRGGDAGHRGLARRLHRLRLRQVEHGIVGAAGPGICGRTEANRGRTGRAESPQLRLDHIQHLVHRLRRR